MTRLHRLLAGPFPTVTTPPTPRPNLDRLVAASVARHLARGGKS